MKKTLCIVFTLSLIFTCLLGCQPKEYENPAYLYYPRIDPDLPQSEEIITFEIRDGNQYPTLTELLTDYFQGPDNNRLYSPFPLGGAVSDINIHGKDVTISLNDDFNQLTGLEFSIASSCLAMTVLTHMNLRTAEINVIDENGHITRSVVLTRESIILNDSYIKAPAK